MCAYEDLGLDGSSAFHVVGNWVSSAVVAITIKDIVQKHRTCLPSGQGSQCLEGMENFLKLFIVGAPWLAQSLSVYTFFHSMPAHGYVVFAPMRAATHIPYAGYPIALAMNAPQGIFDWQLFTKGRQAIAYDFLSVFRSATFWMGLVRLFA